MINYYLLTKPGIVLGNLVTVAAGFILASNGHFNLWLFTATLLGLALIMASACVFNNYIDQDLDRKMNRTKNRPLVKKLISGPNAILYASILGLIGAGVLLVYTNLLTAVVAGTGFFVYVILYSVWKSKTVYGTAIGSIAGAVPPVVGYCAVSNRIDAGAVILFTMMVWWQMPHFFAITLLYLEDYARAGIPVLPLEKGVVRTKIHMLVYIGLFICASGLLTLVGYTGFVYLGIAMALGLAWFILCIKGFESHNDKRWGQQMFRVSLLTIIAMCAIIPFDLK